MDRLEEWLHEARLHWTGTDIGLYPVIAPGVLEGVTTLGPGAIPELIQALDRESEFATAHVLLTRILGLEHETSPTWNGLVVELRSDGEVEVDPRQRFELAQRWIRWNSTDPRPDRLSQIE